MASKMIFGHIIKRKITDMSFVPGYHKPKNSEQTEKMWKNVSLFIGIPSMILAAINAYLTEKEFHETFERSEYVQYEYMAIMNKRFPWGDGKHPLFFNAERNPIPGVGYEAPWGGGHH